MVVRGAALGATMSDYLVTVISASPNIELLLETEVVDGSGSCGLDSLTLLDRTTGTRREVPAAALFVLIGGEPRTEWLAGSVDRDARGYLLTGEDVLSGAWPLSRPPRLLETWLPWIVLSDVFTLTTSPSTFMFQNLLLTMRARIETSWFSAL